MGALDIGGEQFGDFLADEHAAAATLRRAGSKRSLSLSLVR